MITPAQCRAARGLVGLSQQQLADAARVGVVTVRHFEGGGSEPRNATLDVLQRAFEAAGVIFVEENGEGPGVRLKKQRAGTDDPRPAAPTTDAKKLAIAKHPASKRTGG